MKKLFVFMSAVLLLLCMVGCTGTGKPMITGNLIGHVVTGADQTPVANAEVLVFGHYRYTDENGYFEYDNLPAANHTVVVSKETFEPYQQVIAVPANESATLEVSLTPLPLYTVSGIVYNSNAEIIPNVSIEIYRDKYNYQGTIQSDENGVYSVEVYPGTYRFYIDFYDETYGNIFAEFKLDVTDSILKDIYTWCGSFHISDTDLLLTWPAFNLGNPVTYTVDLYKTMYWNDFRNSVLLESNVVAEPTLQLPALENGGLYVIHYAAYDSDNELIAERYLSYQKIDYYPTHEQQIQKFIHDFQSIYNFKDFDELAIMISDNFTDAEGRTKEEFISYLEQNFNYNGWLLYDMIINVTDNPDGTINSASVELMRQTVQDDYYDENNIELLNEQFTIRIINENGFLKLAEVY